MKLTLEEKTRSILYNEEPCDDVCRQEITDFLEESKEIYQLAVELNEKIKERDKKEMEKMVAENPEYGEQIHKMIMARIDLDYIFDMFPDDDKIPQKYKEIIDDLSSILHIIN